MNKIYKVIWNKTKGCYVVASELANRNSGRERSCGVVSCSVLLGLLIAYTLAAFPAYATTGSGASSGFGSGPSGVSYTSTQPEGQNGLAIGVSGSTYAYGNANTVAIGTASVAYGNSSVAIGGAQTASGYNGQIALGWTRTNGDGAVAIGGTGTTAATGTGAVAIGGNYSIASGTDSVALGDSGASGNRAVALGGSSATGANTFAASGAVVNGAGSIAIGQTANVTAVNSSVIGANNQVSGTDSAGAVISGVNILGNNNKVNASGTSVIGNNNTVAPLNSNVFILGNNITTTAVNSVFLGSGSAYMADGNGSPSKGMNTSYTGETINGKYISFAGGNILTGVVSVGSTTATRRIQGVAPGLLSAASTDAVNGSQLYAVANSLATSINSTAQHYYSINTANSADVNYNNDGAVGTDSMAAGKGTLAYGNNSTAIGKGASTGIQYPANGQENATNATAIGTNAKAYAKESIAIGSNTLTGDKWNPSTSGMDAIAIGNNAQAVKGNSIALGNTAIAQSDSAIVLGYNSSSSTSAGANNIVIGTNTKAASGSNSIIMGTNAQNNTANMGTIVLGYGANTASGAGINSIAIGTGSTIAGTGLAIGSNAKVESSANSSDGAGAIAIGDGSSVGAAEGGIAIGKGAQATNSSNDNGAPIAIGQEASATGTQSIALGYQAKASGGQTGQTVIGATASADGMYSTVIGYGAKTSLVQADQTAIGHGAQATATGGVALGANSIANISGNVQGYIPSTATASQQTAINATTSTTGAVSVGSSTVRRQIINVAAGSADTDAVNVAQLKAVASQVASSASQDFTVGADSAHSATGINITKDNKRFDIVGDGKVTTSVSGTSINVGLSSSVVSTLNQVGTNTTNITKNASDISTINTTIGNGLNFQGDDLTPVNKQLGDTLTVKGGTTTDLTDGNIGVVSDVSGALNVKLKKDIDLGSTGSIVTGAAKLNTNGLAVDGKTYVAATGLNANNAKISNVSAGTLDTDAVNVQQMRAELAADKTYMDNGINTTVSGDGSSANPFAVNLNNNITLGDKTNTPDKAITIDGMTGVITAGNTVIVNGVTGNITAGAVQITGSGTVNGLTNLAWDIDSPTVVSGQAATEDQLKVVSDGVKTNTTNITSLTNTVNGGLSFGGDSGTAINKQLGQRLDIKGGATTDLSDGNIGVVSDGTNLNVKLAKTLTGLDSVTAGGTTINSTGLTVGGNTYVTAAGIDANSQTITNVASGGNTTTNAANIGDVARIAAANDKYVTGGAASYGTDGKGSATLTGVNGLTATVTGLQDTYITGAATTDDGKTATLTRNDNQTFTLDLTNTIKAATDQAAASEKTTTLANGSNTTVSGTTTGNNTEYKVNVNTDGKTITTNENNLSAVTTALESNSTTGKVTATTGTSLVTGDTVASAINSASFNVTAGTNSTGAVTTAVKAGDTVTYGAGSNLNVTQAGSRFTYALNSDLTGISTISNTKTDSATGTTTGTKLTLSDESNTVDLNGAQVTNMASGGTTETNGATIGDVKSLVNAASTATTTSGLNFEGNDGDDNKVHRDLGTTLSIKGGLTDVTTGVSSKNLGVKKNDAGDGLELVMSENPAFESVTAGTGTNTKVIIGDDGVSVGGNTYITNTGINANGQVITNVKAGDISSADSKDAVNGGQLFTTNQKVEQNTQSIVSQDTRITSLEGGFTVTAGGDASTQSTVKSGETLDFTASDNAVVTTTADSRKITIGMSKTPTLDSMTVTNTAATEDSGDVVINGDGINAGNKIITNVAAGVNPADAVNKSQLDGVDVKVSQNADAITTLQGGWKVKADAVNGGTVAGSAEAAVQAGDLVTLQAGKNLAVQQAGQQVTYSLQDAITLGTDSTKQVSINGNTGIISLGANAITINGRLRLYQYWRAQRGVA